MDPLVEILDLSVFAGGLEAWPDEKPTFAINVGGWALGGRRVRFLHDADVLWEAPVDLERPDVADAHPDVTGAERSGFYVTLSSLPLPPEFELRVVADDGTRIGTIRGRRAPLPTVATTGIRPLMLTGFSRTGSNLVLRMLGTHPEIATYRPFQYEPRVLTYWIDVFRELTEPASYLRQVTTQGRIAERGWWLGTDGPAPRPLFDPEVQRAVALDTVEDAADFCRHRIARVYARIGAAIDRPQATLFAEKQLPGVVPTIGWELYPDAREVFLVRDFRDMIASVLAWRERFGGAWFGHAVAENDEAFVRSFERFTTNLLASWRRRFGRAHLLRYEDLLHDPEHATAELARYLGVTPDRMAATVGERSSESDRYRTTDTPQASIGRWRRDLTPALQEAAQEAFGPALSEFGYE